MILTTKKRICGLIGAPRAGKSEVAQYLKESRDFVVMAFADKIKAEYGISNEDFETAKLTGRINQIRSDLWAFSEDKKRTDPYYFIGQVIEDAQASTKSVVIADIRTPEEANAIYLCALPKLYFVSRGAFDDQFVDGILKEATLTKKYVERLGTDIIKNDFSALYKFMDYLQVFFFKEDVFVELYGDQTIPKHMRLNFENYIKQFNIREK